MLPKVNKKRVKRTKERKKSGVGKCQRVAKEVTCQEERVGPKGIWSKKRITVTEE